jgi:hypothetical protein
VKWEKEMRCHGLPRTFEENSQYDQMLGDVAVIHFLQKRVIIVCDYIASHFRILL